MLRLTTLFIAALLATSVTAENRYVTDEFEFSLRAGPGTKYKITKLLKSGSKVTLIKKDKNTGYSQIRTEDGKKGWILSRQLQNAPVARDRLASAQRRSDSAAQKQQQAEDAAQGLQAQLATLQEEHQALMAAKQDTEAKLNTLQRAANNVLSITAERDQLLTDNKTLQDTLTELTEEREQLSSKTQQRWFLIGAGVLFVGLLLGLILPRLRPRRKSSWGSL